MGLLFVLVCFSVVLFLGACIGVVFYSRKIFLQVKTTSPSLYKKLLSGQSKSWIERGSYLPTDAGIQFRLYRTLYSRDDWDAVASEDCKKFTLYANTAILGFVSAVVLFLFFAWNVIRG